MERNFLEGKARIKLKEYLYKINPDNLGLALEAVKDLEFDKENVVFDLNNDNTIKKVVNFLEIKGKWENFKPKLAASNSTDKLKKSIPKQQKILLKEVNLSLKVNPI